MDEDVRKERCRKTGAELDIASLFHLMSSIEHLYTTHDKHV